MNHSLKILSNAKAKKAEEIFDLLDPDKCGKINKNHLEIENLSSMALDMLSPLFLEIENKNLTLSK